MRGDHDSKKTDSITNFELFLGVLIRCCTQDVHPVPDDAEVTELPGSIFVPVAVAVILFSWSAMETNGTSSYRQLSSHKETFIEEVR